MDSKTTSFANLACVCVKDHKNSDEFSLDYFCLGFHVAGGLYREWLLQCHYRFSARAKLANNLRCYFAADCRTSHQATTKSFDFVTIRLHLATMSGTKAKRKFVELALSRTCQKRKFQLLCQCSNLVIPIILFIGHSNVSVERYLR